MRPFLPHPEVVYICTPHVILKICKDCPYTIYYSRKETWIHSWNFNSQLVNYETNPPKNPQKTNLNHLFFADDLIFLFNTKEGLQNSIDCVSEYCIKSKLTVNLDKTKALIFSNKKIYTAELCFYYNHSIVNLEHKYKDLGIIFT